MDVDGPGEVAIDGDAAVVAASVFKVLVAVEYFRQAADGGLDEAVRLHRKLGLAALIMLVLHVVLLAVDAVNRPKEFMAVRRALTAGQTADPAVLADESAEIQHAFTN